MHKAAVKKMLWEKIAETLQQLYFQQGQCIYQSEKRRASLLISYFAFDCSGPMVQLSKIF